MQSLVPESIVGRMEEVCLLQEAQFLGAYDGLGPVMHAQLAIDAAGVLFDRVEGDDQRLGDVLVRVSLADQVQDLELAIGERINEGGSARGRRYGG